MVLFDAGLVVAVDGLALETLGVIDHVGQGEGGCVAGRCVNCVFLS